MKLSDLKDGVKFTLKRTGRRYILKRGGGHRYHVKPINHEVGIAVNSLHRSCDVIADE